MESEESESQMSVYTEPTGNDLDEYELSEVHGYLTDKLKRLFIVIDKYHTAEANNPEAPVTGDPQHLLKYKMQLVSCLSQQLRSLNPQEYKRFSAHAELDLMASLKKEVQDLSTLLHRCNRQLDEDKKELAGLKQNVKHLKDMYDERQKNPEIHRMDCLLPVQKKLSLEFNEHRIALHDMIEQLFRQDSNVLASLLQEITSAYFDDESGDPYVTVESNYHCLEMLLEADIITRHPHDLKKFRLTNFLQ